MQNTPQIYACVQLLFLFILLRRLSRANILNHDEVIELNAILLDVGAEYPRLYVLDPGLNILLLIELGRGGPHSLVDLRTHLLRERYLLPFLWVLVLFGIRREAQASQIFLQLQVHLVLILQVVGRVSVWVRVWGVLGGGLVLHFFFVGDGLADEILLGGEGILCFVLAVGELGLIETKASHFDVELGVKHLYLLGFGLTRNLLLILIVVLPLFLDDPDFELFCVGVAELVRGVFLPISIQ